MVGLTFAFTLFRNFLVRRMPRAAAARPSATGWP
jgi:hypothetical protein